MSNLDRYKEATTKVDALQRQQVMDSASKKSEIEAIVETFDKLWYDMTIEERIDARKHSVALRAAWSPLERYRNACQQAGYPGEQYWIARRDKAYSLLTEEEKQALSGIYAHE